MAFHALIFDVGGVLLRTEDQTPRRRCEEQFGLPRGGLAELVFNNPVAIAAMLGKASSADIWTYVGKELDLADGDLARLQEDFWAGDRWDEALIGFAKGLRPRVRTGILSNAWPDARQSFAHLADSGAFDVILLSAEEGLMKPDRLIFELALRRLQTAPAETVFVDDMAQNVEAARAMGMQAVHFTTGREVLETLRALLA